MDAERFDRLTRRFATSSRRRVLRGVVAAAGAGLLARLQARARADGGGACLEVGWACAGDGVCCSGRCEGGLCEAGECRVDTHCPGADVCRRGVCIPTDCGPTYGCGPNQVCCDGFCRMGDCCADAECPDADRCFEGQCAPIACATEAECAEGQSCCEGVCRAGRCCADLFECDAGEACCDGACAPCPAGGVCRERVCACPPDQEEDAGVCVPVCKPDCLADESCVIEDPFRADDFFNPQRLCCPDDLVFVDSLDDRPFCCPEEAVCLNELGDQCCLPNQECGPQGCREVCADDQAPCGDFCCPADRFCVESACCETPVFEVETCMPELGSFPRVRR